MQLWLNSPIGYPFSEKIEKTDTGRLKSFLMNTTPDQELQQEIVAMTHDELIETFERNGFTFDEEWFGPRLLDWQKERM